MTTLKPKPLHWKTRIRMIEEQLAINPTYNATEIRGFTDLTIAQFNDAIYASSNNLASLQRKAALNLIAERDELKKKVASYAS